jgi:glycosyltransferase involved in cell wall biosynthesis
MKLTIFFDHRYQENLDGSISSPSHYNYDLFKKRYLRVFDHVDVVSRSPKPIGQRIALGPDVDLVSVGTWNGAIDYIKKHSELKVLIRNILKEQTAVLMIVPGKLGELAYRYLHREGRPYSVEVVGDSYRSLAPGTIKHPLRPLFRAHYFWQQKKLCAKAAGSSYVTEYALQKTYPPSGDSFSTHYSSIELTEEHFSQKPKSYLNHTQHWRLINIGTMNVYYKGQVHLIEAVARCRNLGLDIDLVLLGDGAIRCKLESYAIQLGIREHIKFMGHLSPGDPVRAELDRSDLFVLPSLTEGLPRALMEGMARGLPCIGTNIPGIAELLNQESLVPIKNSEMLAQKIASFLGQPGLLESQAVRNHAIAKKHLNSILMGRRLELYNHLHDTTSAYYKTSSVWRKAA